MAKLFVKLAADLNEERNADSLSRSIITIGPFRLVS